MVYTSPPLCPLNCWNWEILKIYQSKKKVFESALTLLPRNSRKKKSSSYRFVLQAANNVKLEILDHPIAKIAVLPFYVDGLEPESGLGLWLSSCSVLHAVSQCLARLQRIFFFP